MIRPLDALRLASTKLRTRKIRTAFTVAIAGLLFGFVMIVIIVTDGAFSSIERMTEKSMTGRYIIGGTEAYDNLPVDITKDTELITKAQIEYKQLIADKKAEAKRLGIDYDPASEQNPIEIVDGKQSVSYGSRIGARLLNEKALAIKKPRTFDEFKSFAADYHPKQFYAVAPVTAKDGAINEMKDGVEDFKTAAVGQNNMSGSGPTDIQELSLVPGGLLKNYMLSDYAWKPSSNHIPIVVTQKRAAKLANYPAPKQDAPAAEKLNYLRELRKKVNGLTIATCYRNSSSSAEISQAINTANEIDAKKGDKTYQKPSYILATPASDSCGAAIVTQDKRSAEEKAYNDKQLQFNKKFGEYVDPKQQKLVFEVVGVAPNSWMDMEQNFSLSIKDMMTALMMSQSFRFAVPVELYEQLPSKSSFDTIFSHDGATMPGPVYSTTSSSYYVEFSSANDARNFAKEQSCQYDMSGCMPKSKPFMMTPFGSNSIGLDEAKHITNTVLLWAIGIVGAIAAIIASFTIGRTIADGRRETAVFRAIGFKRMDISQIYTTYTFLLSLRIVIFALLIGVGAALLINHFYWLDTTSEMRLALNLYSDNVNFSYLGFTPKILIAGAAVILAGLLGMILPLARNVRRNPISDMRDE